MHLKSYSPIDLIIQSFHAFFPFSFFIPFHQGVHQEPTTTTVNNRWSSQLTSSIQKQWTEEDLEDFVRQLSNPQHHVSKVPQSHQTASTSSSSPRKSSLDSQETSHQKSHRPARAPLSRSETDTSAIIHSQPSSSSSTTTTTEKSESSRGSLISGLSGLRLIKNKKLTRSSHATAKKCVAQKSKEDSHHSGASSSSSTSGCVSPTCLSVDLDYTDPSSPNAVFSGGPSSPEESEVDDGSSRKNGGSGTVAQGSTSVTSSTSKQEGGKKRRFRKMLSRPLKRSQSAGCAKDVPSNSFFLDTHSRRKCKDAESVRTIITIIVLSYLLL